MPAVHTTAAPIVNRAKHNPIVFILFTITSFWLSALKFYDRHHDYASAHLTIKAD